MVCDKVFNKPSQLQLHINIHYFEQPFRCESCKESFRTKHLLQKHLDSSSHLNKVKFKNLIFNHLNNYSNNNFFLGEYDVYPRADRKKS